MTVIKYHRQTVRVYYIVIYDTKVCTKCIKVRDYLLSRPYNNIILCIRTYIIVIVVFIIILLYRIRAFGIYNIYLKVTVVTFENEKSNNGIAIILYAAILFPSYNNILTRAHLRINDTCPKPINPCTL